MDPIKKAFLKIKEDILFLKEEISILNKKIEEIKYPTYNNNSTIRQSDNQTSNLSIQTPYNQNTYISTGNKGVPTNKPTLQQTNQHIENKLDLNFKEANKILDSLDSIKKEIRIMFKNLTPQEMLVFSLLYTLEDQNYREITYKIIAAQLKLSESSIRDYINKLINKGIPIEKTKQNNKKIILNISQDLKKVATLATIQKLREI